MTQCNGRVANDSFSVPFRRCTRPGAAERGGKWYCRQHDPVARDARIVAVMEASRKEWADRDAAAAQRRRYESIGQMVCENAATIREWFLPHADYLDGDMVGILLAILAEVDKP